MKTHRAVCDSGLLMAAGACAALSFAVAASAQTPEVMARILAHQHSDGPSALSVPSGRYSGWRSLARLSDTSVLVGTNTNECFLVEDGVVRQVMVRGAQVEGQAPGVVWGGRFDWTVCPLPGGEVSIAAYASGPGIGDVARGVWFVGDLERPAYMNPANDRGGSATPTGLVLNLNRSTNNLEVGPLLGPWTPVLSHRYRPPGAVSDPMWSPLNSFGIINGAGRLAIAGRARYPNSEFREFVVVADTQGARVLLLTGSTLQTDRGPLAIAPLVGTSQPLADGSVVVQGHYLVNPNTLRPMLFRVSESGQVRVIAAVGDRAPGTEAGVTFAGSDMTLITANARGSVLFQSGLSGPGVGPENGRVIYLSRNGTLTLIARSRPGFPLIDLGLLNSRSLNARDEVGIVTPYEAMIYKPGVGTVRVAEMGADAHPALGLRGRFISIYPFLGSSIGGILNSGGDTQSVSMLSDEGRLFMYGYLTSSSPPAGGEFAATFEITSAGCPADFNMDGFADFFDYADFVECF